MPSVKLPGLESGSRESGIVAFTAGLALPAFLGPVMNACTGPSHLPSSLGMSLLLCVELWRTPVIQVKHCQIPHHGNTLPKAAQENLGLVQRTHLGNPGCSFPPANHNLLSGCKLHIPSSLPPQPVSKPSPAPCAFASHHAPLLATNQRPLSCWPLPPHPLFFPQHVSSHAGKSPVAPP